MYRHIAKILPVRIEKEYIKLFKYDDIHADYGKFLGFIFVFGLGLAFAIAFVLSVLFSLPIITSLVVFLITYILLEIMIYSWLSLTAESKGKFVENILPDALQLMAMNLKAGMTTDRALLITARPEFGPLERELKRTGKEILAGREIKYALLDITKGIKSSLVERTIRLIVEGVDSGGELSDLLQQSSEDIQHIKIVEGEIQANVMMYAIFIFFAAGIGAPLLFGVSTYLVGVLGEQFSQFDVNVETQFNIGKGQINVSGDFLVMFSLISLTITSFFGGLIIGVVKGGTEKNGLKIFPLLLITALIVFFVVRMGVAGIFAGF